MVKEGKVTGYSGKDLDIKGDTLCVHGDGPKAIAFVKKITEAFKKEGIEIQHISLIDIKKLQKDSQLLPRKECSFTGHSFFVYIGGTYVSRMWK